MSNLAAKRHSLAPQPDRLWGRFWPKSYHWTRIGIGATRPSSFAAAGTDLVALAGANGDDRKHSSFRDGAVGHGGAV